MPKPSTPSIPYSPMALHRTCLHEPCKSLASAIHRPTKTLHEPWIHGAEVGLKCLPLSDKKCSLPNSLMPQQFCDPAFGKFAHWAAWRSWNTTLPSTWLERFLCHPSPTCHDFSSYILGLVVLVFFETSWLETSQVLIQTKYSGKEITN